MLKATLLDLVAAAGRGAEVTQNDAIKEAFCALEKANPCQAPVESPLLKGEWELLWTTSSTVLGTGRPLPFRPRKNKPILQYLDPGRGIARNLEYTWLGMNRVQAVIKPLTQATIEDFVSRRDFDDFLIFRYGSTDKVGGTYIPVSALERTTIGVRFKEFQVLGGWLSFKAPESARGILEVSYLDDDLRLSRGDRGNMFVLRRVGDEMVAA